MRQGIRLKEASEPSVATCRVYVHVFITGSQYCDVRLVIRTSPLEDERKGSSGLAGEPNSRRVSRLRRRCCPCNRVQVFCIVACNGIQYSNARRLLRKQAQTKRRQKERGVRQGMPTNSSPSDINSCSPGAQTSRTGPPLHYFQRPVYCCQSPRGTRRSNWAWTAQS